MNKKLLIPIVCALLAGSLLLGGCAGLSNAFSGQATATPQPVLEAHGNVTSEGHLVPASHTGLFFVSAGRVSDVKVKVGDVVKKGDVLASLGDRESAQAAVSAAELEQASAQRQLDDLQNKAALAGAQAHTALTAAEQAYIHAQQALTDLDTPDYTTRLDQARQTVNQADDDLTTAQDDFDKVKDMAVDNPTRKAADTRLKDAQRRYDTAVYERDLIINEMDTAKAQVDLTKAQVDDATKTWDERRNGPDPADLTLANARLKNAQDQLAAAQWALSRMDLTAPYDGTVAQVNIAAGDLVTPSQPAIEVADLSKWVVETSDLTEKDVVSIAAGQKASIVPDALPDLTLQGVVDTIDQSYVEKSGDITYLVKIPLDSADPRLRWGMTVTVTFKSE
jgi:HlyD family secretion protein